MLAPSLTPCYCGSFPLAEFLDGNLKLRSKRLFEIIMWECLFKYGFCIFLAKENPLSNERGLSTFSIAILDSSYTGKLWLECLLDATEGYSGKIKVSLESSENSYWYTVIMRAFFQVTRLNGSGLPSFKFLNFDSDCQPDRCKMIEQPVGGFVYFLMWPDKFHCREYRCIAEDESGQRKATSSTRPYVNFCMHNY